MEKEEKEGITHTKESMKNPYDLNYSDFDDDAKLFIPKEEEKDKKIHVLEEIPYDLSEVDDYKRLEFLRKVHVAFTIQLAVVLTLTTLIFKADPVYLGYLKDHIWVLIIASIIWFIIFIPVCCFSSGIKKSPVNYITLSILTIAISIILAHITSNTNKTVYYLSILLTILVVSSLTAYTFFEKAQYSYKIAILISVSIIAIYIVIACILFKELNVPIIISGLGIILFSFYLILDTQVIITKTKRYTINDYVFACISIYYDFIFMFILLIGYITGHN